MANSEWRDVICNTKAKELIKPGQKILTVKYNDPLSYVSNVLKDNNILSVPVLSNEGTAFGFLDTLDICQYYVHIWRQNRDAATGEVDNTKLPKKIASSTAQTFINFSSRNDYRFVYEDSTVKECLNKMNDGMFKGHRLAVHDKDNKLIGIISQTDIMQLAGKYLDKLPEKDKTLKELGLERGVVSMRWDNILGDSLDAISTTGVSALALVDNEGKLVANFSASDLRGLTRAVLGWMGKPTIDFLQHFGRGSKPPIVESVDTTFRACVEKLAHLSKERIHRVYLTDPNDRPIGIVSLSDVVTLLLPREECQMTEASL